MFKVESQRGIQHQGPDYRISRDQRFDGQSRTGSPAGVGGGHSPTPFVHLAWVEGMLGRKVIRRPGILARASQSLSTEWMCFHQVGLLLKGLKPAAQRSNIEY